MRLSYWVITVTWLSPFNGGIWVHSRDAVQAMDLIMRSLRKDWRIAIHEPLRTASTFACSLLLNCLSTPIYDGLERCAMNIMGIRRKLAAPIQ